MKILHVLSQFEVTGAEVYAVTLAAAQQRRGDTVTIVSDTLTTPFAGEYIQHPIGRRSYPQRWKNIAFLTEIIRSRGIDVIHAHSRAASWVSWVAARRTRTAFVSTVHGRQHIHASSKAFSIYGRHLIVVSQTLKAHLVADLGLRPEEIVVIPNGLDLKRWVAGRGHRSKAAVFGAKSSTKVLLFVGRLSGPKGDVVRFLISDVLPRLSKKKDWSFHILGGVKTPDDIETAAAIFNKRSGKEKIHLHGFREDVQAFVRTADIVIGAGRVAIESLAAGKQTVAFGESHCVGPIDEGNFQSAMESNFGDTGIRQRTDGEQVARNLQSLLEKPLGKGGGRELQRRVKEQFDIAVVEPAVRQVYRRARATVKSPSSIPVLMYHRVVQQPPEGSRHGLWVTAGQFEAQMESLKRRGFTPLTFQDYEQALSGGVRIPRRPIILTFDDGYEDNYAMAFPILKRFQFTAVIYMVMDRLRRNNFWDADEPRVPLMSNRHIREMADSGFEFGSHTMTHPNLTSVGSRQVRKELAESKRMLERTTGRNVVSFAYPYGAVNAEAKRAVEEAGYEFAVAADSGPMVFSEDFFEIRRTQVFPWTDAFGFWKKTQAWYGRYKQAFR
ncbi:MAG: polysaccharide deacetylase family protein [Bacteroidota bacterium]